MFKDDDITLGLILSKKQKCNLIRTRSLSLSLIIKDITLPKCHGVLSLQ